MEIDSRIAKASRAFGCLRRAIFQDRNLSVETKRQVYRAAVLLYGAETWTQQVRRLNSFYNCCVRTMLDVTRYQQWKVRLTTKCLSSAFGMHETILDLIMEQQLRWVRHMGRTDEERLPKRVQFGELRKKRPCHAVKKRWRDVARSNVQAIDVGDRWYELY